MIRYKPDKTGIKVGTQLSRRNNEGRASNLTHVHKNNQISERLKESDNLYLKYGTRLDSLVRRKDSYNDVIQEFSLEYRAPENPSKSLPTESDARISSEPTQSRVEIESPTNFIPSAFNSQISQSQSKLFTNLFAQAVQTTAISPYQIRNSIERDNREHKTKVSPYDSPTIKQANRSQSNSKLLRPLTIKIDSNETDYKKSRSKVDGMEPTNQTRSLLPNQKIVPTAPLGSTDFWTTDKFISP